MRGCKRNRPLWARAQARNPRMAAARASRMRLEQDLQEAGQLARDLEWRGRYRTRAQAGARLETATAPAIEKHHKVEEPPCRSRKNRGSSTFLFHVEKKGDNAKHTLFNVLRVRPEGRRGPRRPQRVAHQAQRWTGCLRPAPGLPPPGQRPPSPAGVRRTPKPSYEQACAPRASARRQGTRSATSSAHERASCAWKSGPGCPESWPG